jgi:hypothetical protein
MKELTLPIDLANAILQYLGQRPYQEVAQLIAEIQKAAQAQSVKDAAEVL